MIDLVMEKQYEEVKIGESGKEHCSPRPTFDVASAIGSNGIL